MPTELAHGLQVMQMCRAFAENNCEVELLVPRRVNPIKESPFSYYGVKKIFPLKRLPCLDLIFLNGKNIFFWIQTLTFLISAKIYLLFKHYDILYTREQMAGFFWGKVVLELHSLPKRIRPFHRHIWKRANKLVVLTSFIKERLIENGIPENKIIVAHDGVDLSKFDIDISKENARRKLNLPQGKKLIGYVGMLRTLGMEKGIGTALEAFSGLNSPNAILVLVGGYQSDIDFYKQKGKILGIESRLIFIGRVSHNLIPIYLKAFDALIAPFPKNEHYSFFMSPLKIFEYMASKRPIIATKLLSLTEILKDSALLVEPEHATELQEGIGTILDDEALAENLADKAFERVLEFTWQKRAKNILHEINS